MSPEFGWIDTLTCRVFSPGQRRLLLGGNCGIRTPLPRQAARPFVRVWNRVPCWIYGHSADDRYAGWRCLFCGGKP